jgi:hypothetical protein
MFSEGNAAHPVGCDSPLQKVMAVWCHFLKFELTGTGVAACCLLQWLFGALQILKKAREIAITICSWLSQPTRSLSRIVCGVQEGPKGSKGTLRPDLQANTWPRLFKLKANVSTRNRKDVVKGNPGIAS